MGKALITLENESARTAIGTFGRQERFLGFTLPTVGVAQTLFNPCKMPF